ncbi:MAG: hypothetical protein GXY98_00035 [Erysipelothrix sp.]|nr:hypothetical protein [Erysipelothrix sp.]
MDWIKNFSNKNTVWTVTFDKLPTTFDTFKDLPEAVLKEPYHTGALLIASLCLWNTDKDLAIEMINFLKGPQQLSPYDIQFISERLRNKEYLPYSYLEGSTPKNGYTPSKPYTIKLSTVPTSFDEKGYAKLYLQSSGADSLRPVQLRQRPSSKEWFLWEQMLLSDIRIPISEDLWA